jgi:hypothetical protein
LMLMSFTGLSSLSVGTFSSRLSTSRPPTTLRTAAAAAAVSSRHDVVVVAHLRPESGQS